MFQQAYYKGSEDAFAAIEKIANVEGEVVKKALGARMKDAGSSALNALKAAPGKVADYYRPSKIREGIDKKMHGRVGENPSEVLGLGDSVEAQTRKEHLKRVLTAGGVGALGVGGGTAAALSGDD